MDAVVAPDVEIDRTDYVDITLTVPNSLKVEDKDVQDYLATGILFKYRTAVNGTAMVKDQALKQGDDAYIYYKGFVDGKEFDGGSNWDDQSPYKLGLGSGAFIPGFEESLLGIVPNQTSKENPAEIHVTFPEEYKEELAGKDAVFHVVVEYAVQYTLPEYNRDFVEKTLKYEPKEEFYASDRALLDEFEEYIRDFLVQQNAESLENAKIDALWNHLSEKAVCKNLVADEVSYYFNAYKSEVEYYFDYYNSMGNEEFKKLYPDLDTFAPVYLGLGKDADWKATLTERAELMVKRDMITHAIAELEGMETVTEEEYKAQVKYWVTYYQGYMTEAEIIQNMGETFLKESAFAEKMDKWLMDQVTFTYADGTPVVSNTNNEAETETAEG
jgi:trigger factor